MSDYTDFLRQKIKMAQFKGFQIEPEACHPILFPHQRDIVRWAVLGGNRAIFASFGLGKSVMQCEWLRQIGAAVPTDDPLLIVCPLGVRQELIRDAAMLDIELRFIRTAAEMEPGHRFYCTNYESIRDGKLDPRIFLGVSLDEASVLRSFGSKTYQEFLPLFEGVRFKLVNTATPSPNRFKELIHYAGFLGVMDTGQALTRFFPFGYRLCRHMADDLRLLTRVKISGDRTLRFFARPMDAADYLDAAVAKASAAADEKAAAKAKGKKGPSTANSKNLTFTPPTIDYSRLRPQGEAVETPATRRTIDTTRRPNSRIEAAPELPPDPRFPSFSSTRPGQNPDTGKAWGKRA